LGFKTVMRPAALAAPVLAMLFAAPLAARQLEPAGTGGLAALDRTLAHLTRNARVLVIAAHPDDEDTELLTLLSRGMGVDAAYLALSRGEGGQNLIGPELGEALGLIRTGELLAARGVDGARQYFTRGFDFGFSKTLAETERFWPREEILADALRVARRFRPQVVVSVFSGTPRDGHGQHQMAGVIARLLFEALRDSAWGPVKLYRTTRLDTTGTSLRIPTGVLDPFEGRTLYQLAMASRSLHRSQDMGSLQRIGPSSARLSLVASRAAPSGGADGGLLAGVDTSLPAGLARYASLIDSARSLLGPRRTSQLVPLLVSALGELRRRAPAEFRSRREPMLEEAIATAAGLVADATAGDGRVAPGQEFPVTATAWAAGGVAATVREVRLEAPAGWTVRAGGVRQGPDGGGPGFFRVEPIPQHRFTVTVPPDATPSTPYFMAVPPGAGLYDWSAAPDSLRGEPRDPPLLNAVFTVTVAGAELTLRREVAHRLGDQALGEVRRPLVVVPAVGVTVSPGVMVWPEGAASRTITVELTHGAPGVTEGEVTIEVPGGWPAVAPRPFRLEGEDSRRSIAFLVRAPARLASGSVMLRAVAVADGRSYEGGTVLVDYPHIRPVQYTTGSVVRVEATRLAAPLARAIGYVRGASDLVPEALAAAGIEVTLLAARDLERGELSRFDVIVIGPRAYETDAVLVASNSRLLDWARAGGRLIVQYQQYQFVRGGFAPFPLRIAQPHDRVTDETAPLVPLAPGHPLFTVPNRIEPRDWEGWVQERGLYFAGEWDAAYQSLLETGDGGEALRGGMLVAPLGRGLYAYTGLSFFRQLPAGVPGALRLFVNLLSLEAGGAH
jgi:LmbE family N-acetylglucosaminyl deacetylase